jgi:catechol 2,3-dioxygenase-like lactoylglutathione lyase family enzyme
MISRLDHLVLTVADIPRSVRFYSEILGMTVVSLGDGRDALSFGSQMIKLHQAGRELEPHADHATPGSADLCFLSDEPVERLFQMLATHGIDVVEGQVVRVGSCGPILSVYFRDPDGNLIEVSNALSEPKGGL